MPVRRLVLVSTLAFVGCSTSSEEVRFTDSPSVPGCIALGLPENISRRQEALKYFRNEIGEPIAELSIDSGVICEGDEIFTFNIWNGGVPTGPFFVRTNVKTGEQRLWRPE